MGPSSCLRDGLTDGQAEGLQDVGHLESLILGAAVVDAGVGLEAGRRAGVVVEEAVVVVPQLIAGTPAPGSTGDESVDDRLAVVLILAVDLIPPWESSRPPEVEEALAGNLLLTARSWAG